MANISKSIIKDTQGPQKPTPKPTKQIDIFHIPESIIPPDKRIFHPSWSNKPPERATVIETQGKRVLTTGNMLALVSKPGLGKTSICEALIASILNPKCDSIGFTVKLTKPRDKVLYIDTEQTITDTWDAWARTYKRAGIEEPKIDKRVIFTNFKAVDLLKRKAHVETIMNDNPDIGLIIFDGAGDFIRDSNSIPDSTEFIDWINSFNPRISVVVTLHTNPREDKPRGHMGSELCRRAFSVFLIKKLEDGLREITTDFDYGKVRRDDDQISYFYKYSEDFQMFVSAPDHAPAPRKPIDLEKKAKFAEMAVEIFTGQSECSADFIISKIVEFSEKPEGITKVAAKGIFYRHFVNKIVKKSGDGYVLQK